MRVVSPLSVSMAATMRKSTWPLSASFWLASWPMSKMEVMDARSRYLWPSYMAVRASSPMTSMLPTCGMSARSKLSSPVQRANPTRQHAPTARAQAHPRKASATRLATRFQGGLAGGRACFPCCLAMMRPCQGLRPQARYSIGPLIVSISRLGSIISTWRSSVCCTPRSTATTR